MTDVGGGIFSSESFYGRRDFWALTAAVRLAAGMMHRMGRYGVAGETHMAAMMEER